MRERLSQWYEARFQGRVDAPVLDSDPIPEWLTKFLFWVVIIALSLWFLWVAYKLVQPYLGLLGTPLEREEQTQPATDPGAAVWVQRAQAYHRQGNYGEACRSLYMAMLARLDETQRIPQELSRTDGEYLKILRSLAQTQPYQTLFLAHERLCFGGAELSLSDWQQCQRAYQEISQ